MHVCVCVCVYSRNTDSLVEVFPTFSITQVSAESFHSNGTLDTDRVESVSPGNSVLSLSQLKVKGDVSEVLQERFNDWPSKISGAKGWRLTVCVCVCVCVCVVCVCVCVCVVCDKQCITAFQLTQ